MIKLIHWSKTILIEIHYISVSEHPCYWKFSFLTVNLSHFCKQKFNFFVTTRTKCSSSSNRPNNIKNRNWLEYENEDLHVQHDKYLLPFLGKIIVCIQYSTKRNTGQKWICALRNFELNFLKPIGCRGVGKAPP